MNFPLKHNVPERLFPTRNQLTAGTARSRNVRRYLKISCGLLAMTWPLAAVFAQFSSSPEQSSSASQQSSSQPSSAQAQPPSQAQPANPDQPRQKEDSLAEAARKVKAKKAAAAKGKVYTEDDLSGLKGPGVSVVGDAPKKGASPTTDTPGPFSPDKSSSVYTLPFAAAAFFALTLRAASASESSFFRGWSGFAG